MSLLVFNTPIDTDRCEQLEIDATCASISGCRASLHRDAITLRVNTWLGFRDPSGLCQASVTVSDPTSRCAPPPEMSDECQREPEVDVTSRSKRSAVEEEMKTVMVSSMRGSLVTSLKGASRGRLAAVRALVAKG